MRWARPTCSKHSEWWDRIPHEYKELEGQQWSVSIMDFGFYADNTGHCGHCGVARPLVKIWCCRRCWARQISWRARPLMELIRGGGFSASSIGSVAIILWNAKTAGNDWGLVSTLQYYNCWLQWNSVVELFTSARPVSIQFFLEGGVCFRGSSSL